MEIVDFTAAHIEQAEALAKQYYDEARRAFPALPPIVRVPSLKAYADIGLGAAALENGRLVGFLCSCAPFDNAFRSTKARGVFSPMGANAAAKENRAKIYAALYEAAGEKWVPARALAHAVCLYAHDEATQRQLYRYGFGLRCMDGIRALEGMPAGPAAQGGYTLTELAPTEFAAVYPLDQMLNRHYNKSPFFMNRAHDSLERFLADSKAKGARYFGAYFESTLCAYLRITHEGETFIASGPDYRHITGAFCLPEHRGKGVYPGLLNFAASTLKSQGFTRLGVDFESINPAAYGFWSKHFEVYTHSVVRRIDENIL